MSNNLGISVSSAGGLPIGVSNTNLHGITSAAAAVAAGVGLSQVQAAVAASSTGQPPSWVAAATKSASLAPSLVNNAFESYNGLLGGSNNSSVGALGSWATSTQNNKPTSAIGSKWFSPSDDTSMSNGSDKSRNDGGGNFDDGTAIWGSPSATKSGVDWDNSGQPCTMKISPLTTNHDSVNNLSENIKDAENRSNHGLKQVPTFNVEGKISQDQHQELQQKNSFSNVKGMQSNHLVTNTTMDNGTDAWGSLPTIEKLPSSTIENSQLDSDSSPSVNSTNPRWDDDNANQSVSSRPIVPTSQNSLWDTSSKKVAQTKGSLDWGIESDAIRNSSFYFTDNTTGNFGDSISDQNSGNFGKATTKPMIYANEQLTNALADIGYKDIDIRAVLTEAGLFNQPLTQSTLKLFNELFQQDSLLRDIQSQPSQPLNKYGVNLTKKIRVYMQAILSQLVAKHEKYIKEANPQNNKPFISGLTLGVQGSSAPGGNNSQILSGMSSSCDNTGTNTISDSQSISPAKALDSFSGGLSGLSSLPKNNLGMSNTNSSVSNMSAGSRMNMTQMTNQSSSSWVAAASKSPPSSNGNFEYSGNIGSWSSVNNQNSGKPNSKWETNDSNRRNENGFDDGTAIWGNPSVNKTGIDWAEANPSDGTNNRASSAKETSKASNSVQNGSSSNSVTGWGQQIDSENKPTASGTSGWNTENALGHTNNRMASPPDPIWPSSDKSQAKNTDWPIGDIHSGLGVRGFGCLDDSSLNIRKPSVKNLIQGTKQFHILTEMGFDGEEVENALRSRNMNLESAIEDLRNGIERANNKNENDSLTSTGKASVIGNSYQSSSLIVSPSASPDKPTSNQQTLNRQPLMSQNQQNFDQNSQVSNAALTGPASNQSIRISSLSSNVPSTAQLKHMVQQIQLAVHAGHLNAQILNQPLAPVTLQLLYQLLQHIKSLHQLQIHATQQFGKSGSHVINVQITKTKQTILNLQNQIAVQQALFLKQNQQQTLQPGQVLSSVSGANTTNTILSSTPFGENGLSSIVSTNGSYKATTDPQSQSSNTTLDGFGMNGDESWRSNRVPFTIGKCSSNSDKSLSSLMSGDLNDEFTRAPGPSQAKGELGVPRSSAWSSFGTDSELVWPSSSGISPTSASQQSNAAFDLVPEFEPGKPWRGSILLKNVEDDPTMTPGSLARSMVSQQQKNEVDDSSSLFSCWPTNSSATGTKTSQAVAITTSMSASNISDQFGGLSLQANPWKYSSNSPSAVASNDNDTSIDGNNSDMLTRQSNSASDANASSSIKRNSLSSITLSNSSANDPSLTKLVQGGNNRQQAAYSWVNLTSPSLNNLESKRAGMDSLLGKIPSGRPAPPPGLPTTIGSVYNRSDSNNGNSNSDNGSSVWGTSSAANAWDGVPKQQQLSGGSQWLLLRNLTLQSDGGTIKTLCSQHGPMQLFHLYLNHGFALVRYSSREEAAKARSSLNNCIINGTTIIVDTPSDQEVQHYLQLGASGQQNNW